jgi:hypothetical protein
MGKLKAPIREGQARQVPFFRNPGFWVVLIGVALIIDMAHRTNFLAVGTRMRHLTEPDMGFRRGVEGWIRSGLCVRRCLVLRSVQTSVRLGNNRGRIQPIPVVGAAGRDPGIEQQPGYRTLPQPWWSWSEWTAASVADFQPSRAYGPQQRGISVDKVTELRVFALGEGSSKRLVFNRGIWGKATKLERLSPKLSRHKKTLQAGAGRVELNSGLGYSQAYLAKASLRARSATSSVTDP